MRKIVPYIVRLKYDGEWREKDVAYSKNDIDYILDGFEDDIMVALCNKNLEPLIVKTKKMLLDEPLDFITTENGNPNSYAKQVFFHEVYVLDDNSRHIDYRIVESKNELETLLSDYPDGIFDVRRMNCGAHDTVIKGEAKEIKNARFYF